jgi:DNA (cytosine-5)-methyltransferase 1
LLPSVILFENVPGLMDDHRFTSLQERLAAKQYHVDYKVLNLAAYGIPQRRRRLIIIGSRLGEIHIPAASNQKSTVRHAIEKLPSPGDSDDPIHRSIAHHSTAVTERIKKIPKNGGSRTDLGADAQLACHRKFDGYKDVYGRMAWDKPAPTITRFSINPSKGRYLHPEQDREITMREAALLQTFPPDYRFPLDEFGRFEVASMIGEALPPKFAQYVGEHIAKHIAECLHLTGTRHAR